MRKIFNLRYLYERLRQISNSWPGVIAVVDLFAAGSSVYTSFIEAENLTVKAENERMLKKIPKGPLTGYYINVHYIYKDVCAMPGLPEIEYWRDLLEQDKYVVLPEEPNLKNLLQYYNPPLIGWGVSSILNIRPVATVRLAEKEPVIITDDSQRK